MPFVTIASKVALEENDLRMIEKVCKTAWASMTDKKSGGDETFKESDVAGVAIVENGYYITGYRGIRSGICILFIYKDRGEDFKQALCVALEDEFITARDQRKHMVQPNLWWCHIVPFPTSPKLWFADPS